MEPMIRAVEQAGTALFAVANDGDIEQDAVFHFAEFLEAHAEKIRDQWEKCRTVARQEPESGNNTREKPTVGAGV